MARTAAPNLEHANLSDANLQRADPAGADLGGAQMNGADPRWGCGGCSPRTWVHTEVR
ncbi:pentapeptide repeat-containing protein [Micromonospora sp. NBC_00860]|uniref:pentapeptide repeat-containing protein n=1 Tax=Micromonospora sp. NBC_00860 TaxID=2975980 RepID=UPI003867782B